jgi:hypothetical protein
MKKLLFVVIALLTFSGCRKDNISNGDVLIVGKWKYSYHRDLYLDANGNVTSQQTTTTWPNQDYILFNSDKTGGYYNNTALNASTSFTYMLSGNKETEVQNNASTVSITIVSLTSTELQRHYSITAANGSMHLSDETLIK